MGAFRTFLLRATQRIGTKPRAPQPSPAVAPMLDQVLRQGDRAALISEGPSLPFLDTSPLTHHVDGDRKST